MSASTSILSTANQVAFCRRWPPCRSNISLQEYLNTTTVQQNQDWLFVNGHTFVQLQRTCDATILATGFSELNRGLHIAIAIVATVLVLVSFVTNIAIILTTNNDPKLNYVGGLIRKHAALSDLLLGSVVGSLIAYIQLELVVGLNSGSPENLVKNVILNKALQCAQGYLLRICVAVTFVLMNFEMYNRYKQIEKPLRYEVWKNKKLPMFKLLCSVVWLVVAVFYIYPMADHWAYYTMSPDGAFVSTVGRCTAENGTNGIWFFRSMLVVGLIIVCFTITWVILYLYHTLKLRKTMSSVTKRLQVSSFKLAAIGVFTYTVPCILYICGAVQEGIVVNPGISIFLVFFFLVRSSSMFFIIYYLHHQFRESAKSLVNETIPRKIMQFRYRFGIGKLN